MRIRKRKIFLIFFIVMLMGGGAYGYLYKKNHAKPLVADQYLKPVIGNITDTVTAQGLIETKDFVEVGAQISGQVKKMHFQAGDAVKKGDLLAEIDPEIYQAKVWADRAHLHTLIAQLHQQEAQAELAKQQYDRGQILRKSDAMSQESMESTESNLKVTTSAVESSKSQIQEEEYNLKSDEANLRYTKIYAPMDGIVLSIAVREGQTINSNQQAPVVLIIANLDTMTLHAKVTEADVNKLKAGTPLFFTTLGSGERRWTGKIRRIMPTAESTGDVVLYGVLIDVENKDKQLMHGMSTQVFFVLNSVKNVPTIPMAALQARIAAKDDKTGQAYMVRTKNGDKLVHIGITDRTSAQVTTGLTSSDEVLVPAKPGA